MSCWSNYIKIKEQIKQAAIKAGRNPDDVKIIAVSKKVPDNKLQEFLKEATEPVVIGESYVQEFMAKSAQLKGDFAVHLIGPLQSNKVKLAVGAFDLIQSVHSFKVAELISKRAAQIGILQRIFLQINISADPAKKGLSIDEIHKYFSQLVGLPGLSIEGLMTITFDYDHPESARPDFIALRNLRNSLNPKLKLSMGMSADYEIAVAEGADYVRIGTAIFGERKGDGRLYL